MFENPTFSLPLSIPTKRFSQVNRLTSGSRPRTAATRRARSVSEPVRVFWSLPTKPSGGGAGGRGPGTVTRFALFFTGAGGLGVVGLPFAGLCAGSLGGAVGRTAPGALPAPCGVLGGG